MNNKETLARPQVITQLPFQNGIANPKFPLIPPAGMENSKDYELYKGIVDKQGYVSIVKADISTRNARELEILLKVISDYALQAMEKKPSHNYLLPFESSRIPESWRVTVTVAFGVSLFVDKMGHDRFGLSFNKPRYLKLIPSFPGDDYNTVDAQSDILIIIASDHPYVNVAIARYFAEYINRDYRKVSGDANSASVFKVTKIEQGFGRPDTREFLRFNDGVDNLRSQIDLEKLVFVEEHCNEPSWCIGGSYLVYKKIREMMPVWEAFSTPQQEAIIGREKETSLPLSAQKTGIRNLTPVYPDHKDPKDGPLNAHIRKVQPRRSTPDLFGINDLDRRFLRRPYPFFDGIDANGNAINGLHFLAFMKSIQQQFEHVTNMWQMNPDFPVPGTGIDALYAKGVLKSTDGGYYFCPPAPSNPGEFIGSGLFKRLAKPDYKIPKYIYGYGITFVDIDETVFNTFALVKVQKNNKVVRLLSNQDFNQDVLQEGEQYDFGDFKNAEIFLRTSKPILPVINEIKKILTIITTNSEGSQVVFLTARSDFDNKEIFLNAFRKYGIDIDSSRMYVERTGNMTQGTVAERKKQVVLRYLADGRFRRVRLIDDAQKNLDEFMTIKDELSPSLLDLIRKNHFLPPDNDPIEFFAYLVTGDGQMILQSKK